MSIKLSRSAESAHPWGEQTDKALENFSGTATASSRNNLVLAPIPSPLIRAYAEVKLAALEAVQECEQRFSSVAMEALRAASMAIIAGERDSAFPLPMAQGGAGTSFHLNLCEVLSHEVKERCSENLDPIEDLARFQSTNDTFSTAVIVFVYRHIQAAEKDTVSLQEELVKREREFDKILMTGRTELQDALPMRAGSLFGAWAGAAERDRWRFSKVAERVREVPLGGTAMGTGFGAPMKYVHAAERHLRRITGLPLSRSQNMMDAVALKDGLAEVAAVFRLSALNISRMAADMLYYSSSPVGEFIHPNLQYGSSMMPLKTNPVLLERARGLTLSAMAEADKVHSFAREGLLQLNAYLPFLVRSFSACADETALAHRDFQHFLLGMTPNAARMEANLSRSAAILNALMPLVGYRAMKTLGPIIESEAPGGLPELAGLIARETGLPLEELKQALSASKLTGPPEGLV